MCVRNERVWCVLCVHRMILHIICNHNDSMCALWNDVVFHSIYFSFFIKNKFVFIKKIWNRKLVAILVLIIFPPQLASIRVFSFFVIFNYTILFRILDANILRVKKTVKHIVTKFSILEMKSKSTLLEKWNSRPASICSH